MTGAVAGGHQVELLPAADRRRLERAIAQAARRARRRGPTLASITVEVAVPVDPSAVVAACRFAGEPWFCLEQPDRDGSALAGAGAALVLEASGPDRIAAVSRDWREAIGRAVFDRPDGSVAGSGPVAAGGIAFDDRGCASADWSGFAPASLIVPELCFARRSGRTRLTVNTLVAAGDDPGARCEELALRVAGLDPAARLPELDADPGGRHRTGSVLAPDHYLDAVTRAVQRIAAGEIEKIILARAIDVHAPVGYRPEALLGALRVRFPDCHLCVAGRGDAAFVAASPELLIRKEGQRATTIALAGSARRSADRSVDEHLGAELLRTGKERSEHEIVVRRIVRALGPHAVWVAAADGPELARVANIQHLATPLRAQLRGHQPVLELVAALHPTPAVGGEPAAVAVPMIPALEGLDRGWYAGPLGWTDANEDGEFVVGLRSALIRGASARLYAGVGVVAASDPAAELAETDVKLGALLPLLSP